MKNNINKIYAGNEAKKWYRNTPQSISDFIGKEKLLRVLKMEVNNKSILDLGCGEGYITRKIAKKAKKVIAIDLSKDMIKIANQMNIYKNVYYCNMDIRKIKQITEKFDLIIISLVLHYFKSKELTIVVKNIIKLLKPKGKIFILCINTDELIKHKSSTWLKHKKFNNTIENDFLEIKSLITSGKYAGSYKKVGFYYYKFGKYINSFEKCGLKLIKIKYLSPTKKLIEKFPSMITENNLFVLMIFQNTKNL